MQGRRGIVRLAAMALLAVSICLPGKAAATDADSWRGGGSPFLAVADPSPLDAQTMGERPEPPSSKLKMLAPGLGSETDQQGSTTLNLTNNLQMNISFLYNRSSSALDPGRQRDSLPLSNYSMDYRLLPNFKVGLSGYLYYPHGDKSYSLNRFSRPYGDRVMGLGPGIKYDLGRWSFVVKSQVETGTRDQRDMQNWLRVWYAF
ncbi:MAG: hypothetical protein ACYDIC_19010 [Desulfobaccales bacterium]